MRTADQQHPPIRTVCAACGGQAVANFEDWQLMEPPASQRWRFWNRAYRGPTKTTISVRCWNRDCYHVANTTVNGRV